MKTLKAVALFAALVLPGAAQAWQEPARGTPLRADLMDALRPIAEWHLGQGIEFVVYDLRVSGDRAFASVQAQRPGGGAIDIRQTPGYRRGDLDPAMMDGTTLQALYQQSGRQWVPVHAEIGATDVWYANPQLCPYWGAVLSEFCQ